MPTSKQKICGDCGASYTRASARYCVKCTQARLLYRMYASGQTLANAEVGKAVRKGLLPKPSTLSCEDCGKQAAYYDHRDYNQPLLVAPVCISCNRKRGMAKRKDWTFAEMLAYLGTLSAAARMAFNGLTIGDLEPIRRRYWPNEPQGEN